MPKSKRVSKKNPAPAPVGLPAPVNPRGVESVYANNMQLTISSMDARLLFNEIIAEGGPLTVERRANVVMPIPHLRAMATVLIENIKKHDERAAAKEKQPATDK